MKNQYNSTHKEMYSIAYSEAVTHPSAKTTQSWLMGAGALNSKNWNISSASEGSLWKFGWFHVRECMLWDELYISRPLF